MKMFNIKSLSLLIVSATMLWSCSKQLDIDPQQSVDAEDALKTPADIESALIGAYSTLGGGSLYGNNLILLPDMIVADSSLDWYGTFTSFSDIYNVGVDKFNAEAARTWVAAYDAIHIANHILASSSIVDNADDKARIEGEASFIRGLMYFELVRLYSNPDPAKNSNLGVPLVLTPSKTEEEASRKDPRATVDQVYAQVKTDLQSAIDKLPLENEVGRATVWAARAILARVHLQLGEFAEAGELASNIIQDGPFSLNSGVTSVFYNKNTPESIWEIQQNDQNTAFNSNDGLTTFYGNWPNGVGRADIEPSYDLLDTYDPDDKRLNELFDFGTETSPFPDGLYTKKWKELGQNIPVIRLAEMYLIRAEANLRTGQGFGGASPEEDLAVVRNRAGLAAIPDPTLEDILLERRLELAFEGFRSHDYKRLKRTTASYVWNADEYVLPVPEREILANSALDQNTGY